MSPKIVNLPLREYRWCPFNVVASLKTYTWTNPKEDEAFVLDAWSPTQSRDSERYINRKNVITMDFNTCEKGINS